MVDLINDYEEDISKFNSKDFDVFEKIKEIFGKIIISFHALI